MQNYLVIQPTSKHLKTINGNVAVLVKGISNGVLKVYNTPTPQASARIRNIYLEFHGSCLKTTEKYDFYPELIELIIYIVYELSSNLNNFDPALGNYLFGAVKITKNADID